MDYIIDPMWFYWLQVVDEIRGLSLIVSVFGGMIAVTCLAVWCVVQYFEEVTLATIKKTLKVSTLTFVIGAVIVIALPSSKTLISMMVAKFATYSNAQWTVEAVQGAVDHIVQAIQQVRG